jgi:hypothetical protein
MANPTTNYGFVMPTSTDLVTDLPADFDVFGQAVDTQMLTNANAAIAKTIVDAKGDLIGATAADTPARLAVGTNGQVLTADSTAATGLAWANSSSGMTLITTGTLSATTSLSINSCFTSTYRNYQIVLNITGAGAEGIGFRLRASSTDATTNYNYQYIEAKSTTVSGARSASATSILLSAIRGTGNTLVNFTVSKPQEATNTSFVSSSQDPDGGASLFLMSGSNTNNTAYDGLTIFTTTNAMTGTVSVYGLAK